MYIRPRMIGHYLRHFIEGCLHVKNLPMPLKTAACFVARAMGALAKVGAEGEAFHANDVSHINYLFKVITVTCQ
jgi:hypothetical protein